MRRKRTSACAAAVGVLAALVLAVPAQASEIKAVCVFDADAKAQDKEDPAIGVRLIGGKSTIEIHTIGVFCAGVAKGTPDAQIVDITAHGTYVGVVCGTGKALGTITSVSGPVKYRNVLLGKKFAVHFVAAAGLFFWHAWDKPEVVDLKDSLGVLGEDLGMKAPTEKNWQLAGEMGFQAANTKEGLPPFPSFPFESCVKAFSLAGVFLIDEDGTS